ncbi:MAG: HNH endonuclease [Bacillota bacterium]|nr:HNH endonuclease [Bacillota bacterium]
MNNAYEVRGDVTIIFIKKGAEIHECLIDTSDLPKVKEFPNTWHANLVKRSPGLYVVGYTPRPNRTLIVLHRLIMNAPKGLVVDHINHNPLDNRKENLRIVTNAQNMQNRLGAQSNSKSGVRGVVWRKDINKWQVRLRKNGKYYYFGFYDDLEEAAKASKEAILKFFPFSYEATVKEKQQYE